MWKKRFKKSAAYVMAMALTLSTVPSLPGGVLTVNAEEMPVVLTGAQTETKKLSLALEEGLTTGTSYMEGMVTVVENMGYKSANNTAIDANGNEISYSGYVAGSNNPKPLDGTGAYICFTPEYDGEIQVAGELGKGKTFTVSTIVEGAINKEYQYKNESENTEKKVFNVPIEKGNTYYVYVEGSKMRFYEFSYSYEEKKEDSPGNTQTVTKEKTLSLDMSATLTAGSKYMENMVTVGEDLNYKSGNVTATDSEGKQTSYSGYVTGSNNPKPADGTGAYICFTPEFDGEIRVAGQVGKDKTFMVSTVTGSAVQSEYQYKNESGNKEEKIFDSIPVEANTTYYIYGDGTKMRFYEFSYTYKYEEEVPAEVTIPAFPGAEGGGKYITGGRGKQVYTVTNLDDSGEGSLRWALEESKKTDGGTIVFHVSGNIELKSSLRFDGVKNVTIAGQTAPGDGITVSGYDTNISNSENIIIRYIRFRPGAINVHNGGDSMDAMWGRDNKGFIVDHCSFSWNTDECLSLYRGEDGTVQWCLVYESLTLSGHTKGRHGYGAIAGGDNVTFHHNLYANHTSRNPRIGGGYAGKADKDHVAVVQLNNNIIYNWGFNTTYGGGFNYTNFINNYEVAGPGTREQVQNWVINPGEATKVGGFYINGNYLANYLDRKGGEVTPLLTMENIDDYGKFGGVAEGDTATTLSDTPYYSADSTGVNAGKTNKGFDEYLENGIRDVETTFDDVLQKSGATYPRRDAMDARITAEVENGLGRYINTEHEVGGFLTEGNKVVESWGNNWDTDGDGIPNDWENENGLNPEDATDSSLISGLSVDKLGTEGYTNLEVYLNSLVEEEHVAENPTAKIVAPANNEMIAKGTDVTIEVEATSEFGHTVEKAEFYYSTLTETNYIDTVDVKNGVATCKLPSLPDGSYFISARVYDSEGNATQTTAHEVHINTDSAELEAEGWTSKSIGVDGENTIEGYGNLENGILTVKGNGKLGKSEGAVTGRYTDATKDEFHYVYKELTGDVEITAKLESISSVDNHAFAGIMIREDLDDDAATAALGLSWTKTDESVAKPWSMYLAGRDAKGGKFDYLADALDDEASAEKAGIIIQPAIQFKKGATELGYWMRLVRRGNTFTAYSSKDGVTWDLMGSRTIEMNEKVYVGFAADSNDVANELQQINTARFSNITVKTNIYEIAYDLENIDIANRPETVTEGNDINLTLTTTKGYRLPEAVQVKIGNAKPVDVALNLVDPLEGILTISNVTGPVTITAKAEIDKIGIEQVGLEVIDNDGYLTMKEENGAIILEQKAEDGRITKHSDTGELAKNISYLVFPKTTDGQTMEADITILSRVDDTSKDRGLFVGVFEIGNGKEQFSSLGFRNVSGNPDEMGGLTGYWTKSGGNSGNGGSKSNNGMPNNDPHTKPSYELNKTYHVVFEKTRDGYKVTYTGTYADAASGVYPAGGTDSPEMNLYKVFSDKRPSETDEVQYGFALTGVSAKIENLTLADSRGRIIYQQNDTVVGIGEEKDIEFNVSSGAVTKETIIEKLPVQARVMYESGSYQLHNVTWDVSGLKDSYTGATTITLNGTVEGYESLPATIRIVLKKDAVIDNNDDDDDDDDSSSSNKNNSSSTSTSPSSLNNSEQNKVDAVLGSHTVVKEVVENNAGKLVVSAGNDVVFCEKNGTLSKDKWQMVGDFWYYFGSDSKAVDGWLQTGGKWYYMDQTDKKMETGWLQTSDGKWYLLDSKNGDMKTGWQLRGGKWYLLDEVNGDMKSGWQLRGGLWYLLDSKNGDMKTGWQKTADGKWYYLTASGAMAANTVTPDGYKVDASGAWIH